MQFSLSGLLTLTAATAVFLTLKLQRGDSWSEAALIALSLFAIVDGWRCLSAYRNALRASSAGRAYAWRLIVPAIYLAAMLQYPIARVFELEHGKERYWHFADGLIFEEFLQVLFFGGWIGSLALFGSTRSSQIARRTHWAARAMTGFILAFAVLFTLYCQTSSHGLMYNNLDGVLRAQQSLGGTSRTEAFTNWPQGWRDLFFACSPAAICLPFSLMAIRGWVATENPMYRRRLAAFLILAVGLNLALLFHLHVFALHKLPSLWTDRHTYIVRFPRPILGMCFVVAASFLMADALVRSRGERDQDRACTFSIAHRVDRTFVYRVSLALILATCMYDNLSELGRDYFFSDWKAPRNNEFLFLLMIPIYVGPNLLLMQALAWHTLFGLPWRRTTIDETITIRQYSASQWLFVSLAIFGAGFLGVYLLAWMMIAILPGNLVP